MFIHTLPLLTPVWAAQCTDANPNSCWTWASANECTLNPGYMLMNCKTACRIPLCVGTDGEPALREGACIGLPCHVLHACTREHRFVRATCKYRAPPPRVSQV